MELSRRDKRRLGILPWQLVIKAFALIREGAITKDTTAAELKTIFMAEAQADNMVAWSELGAPDWEAFLKAVAEFLEKIVPLILQIIQIFL